MKCYYEVLNLSRDADDAEIKTAYRKLALRWHPDKNLESPEEAKDQFQLVQQAYEVLSDAHERSWYDNHREQILRGKQSDYEDNSLDLFQYFTVSCFKGYGDDPGGFYHVYADVFVKISAEDAEFMDDEEEIEEIPTFGDSTSSYEEVVGPFYAYWQSYCTKKSYAWLCPYNIQEIKDRRVLREIDKDMKKVVQKAKKERNEEVRNLIAFVRKRDKRVQAFKKVLEERAELNRQKQAQNRLDQIRKRNKELEEQKNQQKHISTEAYEEQLRQIEQEYGVSDDDYESDLGSSDIEDDIENLSLEDSIYYDDLFCVACNKSFKNDKAFSNHEYSKKHRDNIEKLKKEMLEEDKVLETDKELTTNTCQNNIASDEFAIGSSAEEDNDIDEVVSDSKKNKKSKRKKGKRSQLVESGEDEAGAGAVPDLLVENLSNNDEVDWNDGKKSSKKSKSKKPNQNKANTSNNQTPKLKEEKEQNGDCETIPKNIEATPKNDINLTCITCNSLFDSKNKLFSHIKKSGHGVYKPKTQQVGNSKSSQPLETKMKKGKKNK